MRECKVTLDHVLEQKKYPLLAPTLPELRYLISAKKRVLDKWPDITAEIREEDREAVLAKILKHIRENVWEDVKMSFAREAFNLAFLAQYADRSDVKEIIDFALGELRASSKPSIVNTFMKIYSSTFSLSSQSTTVLSKTLKNKTNLLNQRWRSVLKNFPEYLKPETAPTDIANKMVEFEQVGVELENAGILNPFSSGMMEYAHQSYVRLLAPTLDTKEGIKKIFDWINPTSGKKKISGSVIVIESLLEKWLTRTAPAELSQYITENLISIYEDPRIRDEKWANVKQKYKDVFYNWLTKEDLRFFTSVVDATQPDNMWVKRRDFWLELFDEDLIDNAWVAFCPKAERYARENLTQSRGDLSSNRFGRQGPSRAGQ